MKIIPHILILIGCALCLADKPDPQAIMEILASLGDDVRSTNVSERTFSRYSVVPQACQRKHPRVQLTQAGHGYIFLTPNYPKPLPSKTYCGWTFHSTDHSRKLRVFCNRVNLGKQDYIVFRDGNTQKLFASSDQSNGRVQFQFSGNLAYISVVTNEPATGRGFYCIISYSAGSSPVITQPTTIKLTTTPEPTTTPKPTTTTKLTTTTVRPILPTSPISETRLCTCGAPGLGRIVGGDEAAPNDHPWMAGLALRNARGMQVFCGASLISSTHVATAAHCVEAARRFGVSNILVLLGAHDLDKLQEMNAIAVRALEVLSHPAYNNRTVDNDIALVRVSPLDLTSLPETIRPICLPAATDYSDQDAMVAGWGTLSQGGSPPRKLREVTVPVLAAAACRRFLGRQFTSNMICAGFAEGGKDACQGDSGGPLVVNSPSSHAELVGVVSWGFGCARSNSPGVYAKVSNYVDWIAEQNEGSYTCARKF